VTVVPAMALAALALTAGPAAAAPPDDTVWLCKPGAQPNPCEGSLETTVVSPAGQSSVETPKQSKRKIDCFYVYPTASDQQGPNADLTIDPQQIAVAQQQAARYSQHCRVFAPMYRQLTISALGRPPDELVGPIEVAYSDVAAAWRNYLAHYNKGRGVVLIGHSQGTGMLRYLIRQEIDPKRSVRKRIVSAILLGGDVTVKKGSARGGDFEHLPACNAPKQLGCVIAFSVFNEQPPSNTTFGVPGGRFDEIFGLPTGPDVEVLCTNPAALGGGAAPLDTIFRTDPFPGTLGIGIQIMFNGSVPSAPTPWLQPQDRYSGECVSSNGANVLMITPIGPATHLTPSPDETWGLHLADANIALGNLVDDVGRRAKAYLKKQAKKKK
jgi:hypothetical protein